MKKALFIATIAFMSLLASAQADDFYFFDDFESGLTEWTIGGRQLAGQNIANTVSRHGSMMGHLYKTSFTEVTFQHVFEYDPMLRFIFDMEVTASSQSAPSNYYSAAFVRIIFYDNESNKLGEVRYATATTSYIFNVAASDPTVSCNQVTAGVLEHYNLTMDELLSQITIDESAISNITMIFQCYSSTYPYPSVSAELWVDNVTVTDSPPDLCYYDLPTPELVVTGSEDYVVDGQEFTRYLLSIVNRSEFPDEMFTPSPDLPPCGLNTDASRTWVDIYREDGSRIYGFCGLPSADWLTQIWFAVPRGQTPPNCVYVTLNDRRCEIEYTSNLACIEIEPPCEGGSAPIAYWSFDDPDDPGHDDSGNGNDGTVYGATSTEGVNGKALNFDGMDDFVEVLDRGNFNSNQPLSITVWVKIAGDLQDGWPTDGGIVGQWGYGGLAGDAYMLSVEAGKLRTSFQNAPPVHLDSNSTLSLNEWVFLSMVYEGNNVKLYINGILNAQHSVVTSNVDSNEPVVIGLENIFLGNLNYFKGDIDEVQIYDRILLPCEIEEMAQSTCQPIAPVLYYSFDNPDDPAHDDSGNGDNGTVYGATTVEGICGNAMKFDGGDYVQIQQTFAFHHSTDATLSFWMKRDDNEHRSIFWTRGDNSDRDRFNIFCGSLSWGGSGYGLGIDYRQSNSAIHTLCATTTPVNDWVHIVVTRLENTYYLYQNGQYVTQKTDAAPDLPTYEGHWYIGKRNGHMYKGLIDELYIFDRALSECEIEKLAQAYESPNAAPLAICKDITVDADGNCEGIVTADDVDDGSYDPDDDPITLTLEPAGPYPLGDTIVTLTVSDDGTELASCQATVTVVDTTAPVITCPGDVTIECDQSFAPSNTGYATAVDGCSSDVSIIFNDHITLGDCADGIMNIITRTWTATDGNNSSSCDQIITSVDTTAPVISGVPVDTTVECDSVPAPATPTASDNCDGNVSVVFDEVRTDGDNDDNYTLTRIWTSTDNCGNTEVATQTVTVQDTISPEINLSVEPTVLWPPNHKMVKISSLVSASDSCDADVSITLISITNSEGDNATGDGNTTDDIQVDSDGNIYVRAERSGKGDGRVYTIVYEAEDASGNTTQGTATVTVPHSQP